VSDSLGVDLGTTYTAAAVVRDGRAEIVNLGNRAAAVPSLVFLRDDESILVGEAAERRGIGEPQRLAREFKRRVGDTAPIVLGPSPYSAERLSAQLLRWAVDTVSAREGGLPERVAVAHPANWGQYKVDLMRQAVELAGLGHAALITEPVAAAVYYANTARLDVGGVVAVYDLGGGTFDAAVLQRTDDGFAVLGRPEGIERLGGIDFDEAVVEHVRRALGPRAGELDGDDATARTVRAQLRQECTRAKEALSADSDTMIHVPLPSGAVDLRLTRPELEAMIRPPLQETIDALARAVASAGLTPHDLEAVLLVGGSSRIPLVAEMVSEQLGRPVAVDAHPKHAIALGAALWARATGGDAPAPPAGPVDAGRAPDEPPPRSRRRAPVVIGVLALVAALGAGVAIAAGGDGDEQRGATPSTTTTTRKCTSASGRCVFIDDVRIEGDHYVVRYSTSGYTPIQAENGGSIDDHHVHFFFNTWRIDQVGRNMPQPWGEWDAWDLASHGGDAIYDAATLAERGDATQICAGVADSGHGIDPAFSDCVDLPA
jgi:actin-like ATPase involved in cell morphogenesis